MKNPQAEAEPDEEELGRGDGRVGEVVPEELAAAEAEGPRPEPEEEAGEGWWAGGEENAEDRGTGELGRTGLGEEP